jgi:hypothetical protein
MKIRLSKFAVFTASFLTGVFVLLLSQEFAIRKFQSETNFIPTTVCQIQSSFNQFNESPVIVEATTDGLNPESEDYRRESDELPLYPLNCDVIDTAQSKEIRLKFGDYDGANNDLKAMLEMPEPMLKGDDAQPFKEVDVRVSGIIRKGVNKKGEEIFILHPTNIEIISPMRRGFP